MENPKIRFKGFTKDWEQRKFSELYARSSEKNDGSIGMDKNITVATMQFKNDVKVSTTEYLKTYYTFKLGDIAFEGHQSKEFRYGRFVENDIGNGIVSHIFAVFRPIQEYDLYFWKYAINNETLMQRILARSTKASTMMHDLVTNDFLNETFLVPSVKEQKQIGAFLNKLDNLITLHQRKCEQTKKLKKYMLQKMFPQNGAKVPEIRFDGFTYDWEQRKFSELYARSSEKNDGSIGMDKNITVATMQFKNDVKVSTTEYLKTYYTFKLGDIAFEGHQSKEFRYGRFVENDIGNGIVSHIFAVFRPIQEYDLYFWKYAINNETLMQRILARSTKASTMMHDLVTNDFLNETFLVPSVKEQKQIGAFLNKLDNLITLHQRKCEQTKKLKKYMLQKMFPQNGAKVPEIRFDGFTYDWEQRKFSEFVENVAVRNREGLELECYAVTNDRGFISQKEAHDDFGYMADVDKTAYNIVPPNSFAYNPARINVGSIGYYAGTENVIVSSLYEVFQTADYVEDGFLWHWFKSTHFPKWIERLQEGSVRLYFYYDKLIQCEMKMPSLEEQKKIGKYFDNLDHLITLHQRKCDELKKMKKYMLQNMFI